MKKTAVITGASGGIGGAAAIQLAKEGYSLALLGNRSKEKLQKVKQACMDAQPNSDAIIFSLCGDLSNAKEAGQLIQKAVESLGHVDLFLHCAGISHIGLLTDMVRRFTSLLVIRLIKSSMELKIPFFFRSSRIASTTGLPTLLIAESP